MTMLMTTAKTKTKTVLVGRNPTMMMMTKKSGRVQAKQTRQANKKARLPALHGLAGGMQPRVAEVVGYAPWHEAVHARVEDESYMDRVGEMRS